MRSILSFQSLLKSSILTVFLSLSHLSIGLVSAQGDISALDNVTSYDNVFVDPSYIVATGWNSSMDAAQATIITWAQDAAMAGPWSVMNKTVTPPSGDKHDYESWAPYWWPNCTNVQNTTALTDEQIWTECNYYQKDGIFNPDYTLPTDSESFNNLSDAVLYNAIAYVLTNDSQYSSTAANFINTWFIDSATAMNPNLNYAQMERGPSGQNGSHTGVLDLKCMTKIVSGVLILRQVSAPEWTSALDSALVAWSKEYITWLNTSSIALQERAATNNHGSYYFNQFASLQILVSDTDGAQITLEDYFSGIYLGQIDANGEQPLEAIRTRPYHYRSYNLAAMITNARLYTYLNSSSGAWTRTTKAGGNIQQALNFAMGLQVPANETADASEIFPNVGGVGAQFGDNGTAVYAQFVGAGQNTYPSQPWFLWYQPFYNDGLSVSVNSSTTNAKKINGAASDFVQFFNVLTSVAAVLSVLGIMW